MARRIDTVRTSNAAALARIRGRVEGLGQASLDRAVNRAIASVRRKFEPEAKKAIRAQYNVPLAELSGKFRVITGRDGDGEFLGLQASRRHVPLLSFGGLWRGRNTPGATAAVRLGQMKTYRSSFIATIRGRHGIYARQFSADSNSPSGRDPRNKVRRLMGPSPAQMTEGIGMANARRIASAMNSYLSSEIKRQLDLARKDA